MKVDNEASFNNDTAIANITRIKAQHIGSEKTYGPKIRKSIDQICCAIIQHGCVHALNCLEWLCPSTFRTFHFVRHHCDTYVFLSPETRDVAARDSRDK